MKATRRSWPGRSDPQAAVEIEDRQRGLREAGPELLAVSAREALGKGERGCMHRRIVADDKDGVRRTAFLLDDRYVVLRLVEGAQEADLGRTAEFLRDVIPCLPRPLRIGGEHEIDRLAAPGERLADRLQFLAPAFCQRALVIGLAGSGPLGGRVAKEE